MTSPSGALEARESTGVHAGQVFLSHLYETSREQKNVESGLEKCSVPSVTCSCGSPPSAPLRLAWLSFLGRSAGSSRSTAPRKNAESGTWDGFPVFLTCGFDLPLARSPGSPPPCSLACALCPVDHALGFGDYLAQNEAHVLGLWLEEFPPTSAPCTPGGPSHPFRLSLVPPPALQRGLLS